MSTVLNFIKNLPESPADNVVNDVNYIRRSSALVNEELQKGSDIMQMANGDILVTGTVKRVNLNAHQAVTVHDVKSVKMPAPKMLKLKNHAS